MQTWRTNAGGTEPFGWHRVPRNLAAPGGCFGEPLSSPCPEPHGEAGAWCQACQNTGRVAPKRPRVRTPSA